VHKSFENPKSILAAAISMICLLINKFGATSASIPAHPSEVMPRYVLKDLVTHVGLMSPREARNILHMTAIVAKAANMKGDRSASELLNLLMDRLDYPVFGSYLAKEFEHVLGPHEHVDASNFIIIRPLYKQRPYAVCFTQLTKSFQSCTNPAVRANYLVALANILKYTPSETIMADADKILPLMLQSISAFGAGVKSASIKVIHEIILGAPNAAEEHIRSIVRQLLERIHNTLEDPSDAPSRVRGLALDCLSAIPVSLPNRVTFLYKLEVLKELKIAADDVKRSVREETVPCYTAWFSIADPDTSSGSL
jgi:RNAPII transcription regulator C-terminal